jgi:hypothetical protein
LGAASGAAIGAAAGGGPGAALGAAIGGQPEYSGELRVHLHPHRDLLRLPSLRISRLRTSGLTRSRAVDIRVTRDTPLTAVLRAMDTQVTRVSPVIPAYSGPPGCGYQSRPLYSPFSGSAYPVAGYPGDRASEDWSPGAEYAIEPYS